jgi:arabinofuranan 3-O-arabinosyltransferase
VARVENRGRGTEQAGTQPHVGLRSETGVVGALREFPWAMVLWPLAVLIGLLDAWRWHKGVDFGYDTQHVWQAAHAVLHGGSSWNQFVYPPGCLLFAFPFAALPFRVTKVIIYLLQIVSIAYLFWAMTRFIRLPLSSARVALFAVLLALTGQLGIAAHYENFTLLLIPLAAAFFLALDRDHPMAAAVVLGIALTIKPLLAPLLLVLLLRRRWRETAVAVLIPVVLSVIALVVVVAANADFSGFVHEVEHTFSTNSSRPWNTSLSAMARYLHLPSGLGLVARIAVVAVSLFACWRIWSRTHLETAEQAVWFSAPLFVILILCFSFAWGYYSLLLLPLGFVVLRRDRPVDWVVRLGIFLALAPPILVYTIPGYPSRYYAPNNFTIFHLGILLNGASVVGVIITLAGVVMHSYDVDDVAPIGVPSAVEA